MSLSPPHSHFEEQRRSKVAHESIFANFYYVVSEKLKYIYQIVKTLQSQCPVLEGFGCTSASSIETASFIIERFFC